jgi:hypothetical protein
MFTIGIFSTHIPYIAFVLFYVYFLVAGVNKAVAGEIPSGENYTTTELYASEIFDKANVDTYHFFCNISNINNNNHFEDLIFKWKIKYPDFTFAKIHKDCLSTSLFNRPPPVA